MRIESGIKQGCPMCVSICAIAADPLIRAYLGAITFNSSRIGVFADDIALALHYLHLHLPLIMFLFRNWRGHLGYR